MSPVLAPNLQNKLSAFVQAVGTDIKALNGKVLATSGVPIDPWHIVGAVGEAAFQNGWAAFPGHQAPAYRKMPDGTVQLKGFLRNGTMNTPMFTLPAAYRPKAYVNVNNSASYANSAYISGYIQIGTDGTVTPYSGSNAQQSIDDIEFDTETVTTWPTGPKGDKGDKGDAGAAGGNAQVPMDTPHLVGTTGEPAFQNSWGNYAGTGYTLCGFRKFPDGKVRLKGLVSGGAAGTTIFTLPVGYRPPKLIIADAVGYSNGNIINRVDISPTGVVTSTIAGSSYVSLDDIEFDTETVTQFAVGPQGPQGIQGIPGSSVQVPMDTWHTVGAVGEPAIGSGWTTPGRPLRFRKLPDGQVELQGYATGGANFTPIFTLPVGYRPTAQLAVSAQASGGSCQLNILPTGEVKPNNNTGTNVTTYTYLDGVVFDTETVTQFAVGPQGPQGPAGGNATVPMDTEHLVGAAGEPAFTGGWVHADSGTGAPQAGTRNVRFRKFPDGLVRLAGLAKAGTVGSVMFTLPNGYRPPSNFSTVATCSGGVVQLYIGTNGAVSIGAQTGTPTAFVAFDGVEFDSESVTSYMVGPQGPKGDAGGIVGLERDLDGINFAPLELPFRSRLAFGGPNWAFTDGGPADPFGGGDYTIVSNDPGRGSSLPNVNVRSGQEYILTVATGVEWLFRYMGGRWVCIGGAPLAYAQLGENNAYAGYASGQIICVNASSKYLQWQITPLVDVWVEVEFFIGLFQKNDAAYHYIQLTPTISPAPPVVGFVQQQTKTQHAQVQQFEPYSVKARWGLSAGVAYSMYCSAGLSGGSWQYYQGPVSLNMNGKAWPR